MVVPPRLTNYHTWEGKEEEKEGAEMLAVIRKRARGRTGCPSNVAEMSLASVQTNWVVRQIQKSSCSHALARAQTSPFGRHTH